MLRRLQSEQPEQPNIADSESDLTSLEAGLTRTSQHLPPCGLRITEWSLGSFKFNLSCPGPGPPILLSNFFEQNIMIEGPRARPVHSRVASANLNHSRLVAQQPQAAGSHCEQAYR